MRRFPICALLLCPVWFAVANEQHPPIADLRTLAEVVDQPGSEGRTFSIAEATIASPTTRLSDIFAADDGTAHLHFSVRDDGCGFDPDNCPDLREGHFGLQGVRERIKKFNGKMTVDSHPGAGTRIAVSMVLSAGRRHEDMT